MSTELQLKATLCFPAYVLIYIFGRILSTHAHLHTMYTYAMMPLSFILTRLAKGWGGGGRGGGEGGS